MHTTTLRKLGSCVMLAVPAALLDALGLTAGARVVLTVENGRLVVHATGRPTYTLEELLAQCDPEEGPSADDRNWFAAQPVGRELL
jgi:antitoxin ChpS